MFTSVSPECLSVHYVYAWCTERAEEGAEPLELNLHMVGSCPGVLGLQPVFYAGASALNF